tara:strand:+ start:206 stop:2491 length:2286 start_codon:yes stop_codon:yes gene_type:complete
MPLVNFANLDFDQIKVSIKDYLRANSKFTDYDFEGSNLSSIIDILAYNTYITSYNANMVSNEVFLDSATLRENVVSLIQNIGYLPRSRRAARVNISFYVDTSGYSSQPQNIKLSRGIVATTTAFANESYTFCSLDNITRPVNNNRALFSNIELLEGTYITTNFTVDSYDPKQRFILPNSGIDTTTIKVTIKPSRNSNTSRIYNQTGAVTSCHGHYTTNQTLFEVNSESAIYWIQEIEGERYELIFGDGIFGKKLEAPSYIEVSYVVCSGADGNGINALSFSGVLTDGRAGGIALTSGISLLNVTGGGQGTGGTGGTGTGGTGTGGRNRGSFGGAPIEDINSIKKYGPRVYASQNRAVTADDYEALIPNVFPETEAISCYGGEELSPPRFGKVYCAVKPANGNYLSNALKENLKNTVRKYNVGGIDLELTDLKYLYIEPDINAYYNCNLGKSIEDIINAIINAIAEYINSGDLGKFGATFNFSKFQCMIDGADPSITSNITSIRIRRDLRVALNSFAEYELCFGNCMFVKNCKGHNIRTTGFHVSGIQGMVYLSDKPNENDHSKGTMFLFRLMSPTQADIVKQNVGTIDYEHGEIKLAPINIVDTDVYYDFPVIEFDSVPCSNNVQGLHDLYLQLGNGNGDDGSGNGSGIDINAACDTEDPADNYGGNELVRGTPHFGCNTDGTVTTTSETVNNPDGSYTTTTTSAGRTETVTYYPDGRTTMQVTQATIANEGGVTTMGATTGTPTTATGGGGMTGGGGGGY